MTKPKRPKRVKETFESSVVWGADIHGKPIEMLDVVGPVELIHPCWRVGDRVRVTVEKIEARNGEAMSVHTKATNGGPREDRRKNFASRLALMKFEAGELGLFATMQRLDAPLRMVGFEIAGDIPGCEKYEARRKELTR